MERTGRSIYLMLCTVVDYEGKMIQNQEKIKSALRGTLRCDSCQSPPGRRFYEIQQFPVPDPAGWHETGGLSDHLPQDQPEYEKAVRSESGT